jgi:hypothetical protein
MLHRQDPYAGFDPSAYPQDMQGWGWNHPFFAKIMEAIRPAVIIEVGTWKGASAIHMARLAKTMNLPVEIVCIDTWLGSPEHLLDKTGIADSLKYVNGYPSLYYTFLSNVVAAGVQDIITPFPIASESAVVVLQRLNVRAAMIYIDAAHEFDPAYRDIAEFWKLLTDDGIMLCDDYGYSDVTAAACTFAGKMRCLLYATHGKAILSKKSKRQFHLNLERIIP